MNKKVFVTICLLLVFKAIYAGSLPSIYKVPFVVGGQFYDYQNYHRIPYLHGGIDLCAPHRTQIFAPVSGKISINTYSINAGLSPHRFEYNRIPFRVDQTSHTRYLEISILDDSGNKWMLRHIAPNSIPASVRLLADQNGRIAKDTLTGNVMAWHRPVLPVPVDYDHIHLEIIASDGKYLNPANFVKTNRDYYPPVIHKVFFVKHDSQSAFAGSPQTVINGKTDIITMVNDRMNRAAYQHSIYSASYGIEQMVSGSNTIKVLGPVQAYLFDKLPITGDRTQLSRVIYKDMIMHNRQKYSANGNDGPRIFLLNLTAGSITTGYNSLNCFDSKQHPNGLYRLNVKVSDFSGNESKTSVEFYIKN